MCVISSIKYNSHCQLLIKYRCVVLLCILQYYVYANLPFNGQAV